MTRKRDYDEQRHFRGENTGGPDHRNRDGQGRYASDSDYERSNHIRSHDDDRDRDIHCRFTSQERGCGDHTFRSDSRHDD